MFPRVVAQDATASQRLKCLNVVVDVTVSNGGTFRQKVSWFFYFIGHNKAEQREVRTAQLTVTPSSFCASLTYTHLVVERKRRTL